jgi:hypothetical protein
MQSQDATLTVRFTAEGWHRWPNAPEHRAYLASSHRHLFHVEVSMRTFHDDREIEFHDVLDWARAEFGSGDFGSASCEMLARALATSGSKKYGRRVTVAVFEDGEAGAEVWADE